MATEMFGDAKAVAHYAEGPPRQVPGFHDLHTMALVLLSETVPRDGRVLVLGAGGGLELSAFAAARPGWRLVGVDPSAEMLGLAIAAVAPWRDRVTLHLGTVEIAPDGPFDGAVCLLTLHFLEPETRLETLQALRQRLQPGAPLVVAHHSVPGDAQERGYWLAKYAGFAAERGVPAEQAQRARGAIASRLPLLSPAQDEALLVEAGFAPVRQFYAAFTFRGWVAYA